MTSTSKVVFTAKRVAGFKCPPEKQQAFLWDATPRGSGLGLRVTPRGKPSYVFQGVCNGETVRMTIGSPNDWDIPDAQKRARELQAMIDIGRDPRLVKAEVDAVDTAKRLENALAKLTVGEAWGHYIKDRAPYWSANHLRDHELMAQQGGEARRRWKNATTKAGPLASLMKARLIDVDGNMMKRWAAKETKLRPASTRLALRHFKAFLRWCDDNAEYSGRVNSTAASGKGLREIVGTGKAKTDCLQREQLPVWFQHVQKIENPVVSAYLQCLLLTGARREELAQLKWDDVNFRWAGMRINDKVEDGREIPLTPYVASLMRNLPRRNEWVFSSPTGDTGRLIDPAKSHRRACAAAGVVCTLHGLRRSFKSLSEWQELPVGVVAQIMGHKPSATAEKHYTVRPLDLLRVHHTKLEKWIVSEAGIEFDYAAPTPDKLKVI